MADSQLVWKDQQATASRTCSSGDTVSVIVNEVILHTDAFVIVQIWGEQASGGGSFKVANAEMGYTLLIPFAPSCITSLAQLASRRPARDNTHKGNFVLNHLIRLPPLCR